MAKASPDWFNAVRVCFSDSDEDVFNANNFNCRPAESNWTESEIQTYGHESTDLESDAVRFPPYVRSVRESVSYFEGLCGKSGSTTQTSADDKSGSAQSESAQRVTSTSDGYAVTGEMHPQPCQPHVHQLERQRSIIDGLLLEIYDRSQRSRADSLDSDTFTECSSASEATVARGDGHYDPGAQQQPAKRYNRHSLQSYNKKQLQQLAREMQRNVTQMSVRLVRQLKRRDRRAARMRRHCDVVTAILHAASLKRQIDTRMKFSVAPPSGPSAFEQWKDAMKAVNRLPMGIPAEFRKKVWLSLADHYIRRLKIDWHNTVRLAFNDRSNPDDDKLGMQIVKDLHRTGCSSFSGQDNEQDRAVLKRVLLAYARWNKRIGYCQGFNVIVALLLDVMERKEDDALKVMIYLIDHVLPESYFDNNLRALSVDMAVFRDLLRLTLPTLSSHLDKLQHAAQDVSTGSCYEPPLTNVFTMQWFLTLFATCLPKDVVLRVWDAILLEGSEILLRTALCLWGKLARRIMNVESADEFYSLMGELSSDMMEGVIYDSDHMITAIYAVAPFPFPQLTELREKYTYNIRPFSSTPAPSHKLSRLAKAVLYSDEEEPDEEELRAMATLPGMSPGPGTKGKSTDISVVGHGVFGGEPEVVTCCRDTVYMERMSTDITALKMQYDKLRLRQRQAHVIIAAVSTKKAVEVKQRSQAPVLVPQTDSPHAMNHLFVGKVQSQNRLATKGHGLATESLPGHCTPTKQVPAQTTADPSPCGTSPAARTPTVSCSLSSRPGRGGAEEDTKHFQDQSAEERLQTGDKGRQLCRVSSLEIADNNNSNVSSCTAPDTGCSAAGVRSNEQNNRQDKPCHFPSSSNSENHILGAGCCEPNTVRQSPQLQVSSEDRMDGADDTDRCRLQQMAFGGSRGHRFSQQREGGNMAVSSSTDKSAGNISSGHVLCENSELSDKQSAAFPSVLEKEQKADRELSQNKVCADFVTKTDADKVCGEDNGFRNSHTVISRSLSLPTPSLTTKKPLLCPATTPTHRHPPLLPSINGATGVKSRHLSSPSSLKCPRPFNPFPVKHLNTNRARTGLKLGLYTPSTLEHIQGQCLGGLKKASHTS